MGDSVTGFDASKYMYDKSAVNTNYATSASEGDSSSPSVESVDLSNDNYASPTNGGDAVDIAPPDLDNGESIDKYINVRADVNGDGSVDIRDVTAMQNSLIGKGNITPGMGDLDGDGNFTVKDVTLLQTYLAGDTSKVADYAAFAEAEMQNFGYLDINKDGKIDDIDASILDSYMVAGDTSENPIRLYLNSYKNKIKYPFSSDSIDVDNLMLEFGDYDGDGLVTNKDVTAMQRDISSNSTSGDQAEVYENGKLVSSSADNNKINYKFDLNGDGVIDDNDADIISNYLAGKDVKSSIDPNKVKYMYYDEASEYSMEGVAATLATKTSAYLDYMYDTGNSDQAASQAYNQWEQSYRESNPGVEPSLSDYAGIKDGTCVDNRAKIDEIRGEMLKYNNFNKSYTNNASKYEEYKSDLLNIMQLKTTNPDLAELKETYLSYKSLQDYLENKRDIYNDWKEHPENYSSEPPEFTSADLQLLSSATSYTSSLKNKIDLGGIDYNSEFGSTEFYEFCNNYDPNNAPADDKYASVEKYLKKVNSTLKPEYQMTAGALYKSVKDEGGPTGLSVDACRELEYIDEEYIMMYHYLLKTKGKDYADKYFEYNKLDIVANQNEGLEEAELYIDNLKRTDINFDDYMKDRVNIDDDDTITRSDYDKLNGLYNSGQISKDDGAKYDINGDGVFDDTDLTFLDRYLNGEDISEEIDYKPLDTSDLGVTMVEGYSDGVEYYVDGVKYRLDESNIDKPSVHDYRNMYIMQYIESKNAQSLKKTYTVSYSIGNMSIPMAASALTYAATKNEKASKYVGLMLMQVSLHGNYKHEAMLEGNSAASSELYALLASSSEVLTEYYMGGIPFFSRFEGNILTGGVLEGAQEYVQTWIQQGIKSAVFGEPIDISAVHGEATEAFDSGAITGILLGGGGKIIHVAIDGITYEVDSNALANISNNGTESVTVEQLRSIATIDPDVQQISQDYDYTNEEASTILTVVNAYTIYDSPDITSSITNTDIMNTLAYLKKTNNTKVYNKILCDLTDEQYYNIKNDSSIPEQGAEYSKSDLFADRTILEKSYGKYVKLNSSQQGIDNFVPKGGPNSSVVDSNPSADGVDSYQALTEYNSNSNANSGPSGKSLNDRFTDVLSRMKSKKYNTTGDTDYTLWSNDALNAKYQQTVDGITFTSNSKSGLNKLVQFYNNMKSNANSNSSYFLNDISGTGLVVTDIIPKNGSGAFSYQNIVFLSEENISNNQYNVFYHEAGHYYDGYIQQDAFRSEYNLQVQWMKSMDPSALNVAQFKSDYSYAAGQAFDEFFNNNRSYFEQDFFSKNPRYKYLSSKAKAQVWNDYVNQQRTTFLNNSGYSAVSDILDAVTNGDLYNSGYTGHGDQYYNSYSDAEYKEVLANISDLYNNGNVDLLYKYLPEQVCNNLIYSYEQMIGVEAMSYKISQMSGFQRNKYGDTNYVDSVIDYLNNGDPCVFTRDGGFRDFMTNLSKETLTAYVTSFTCCGEYFNSAQTKIDSKYGSGSFKQFLNDYYNSGDISAIPDQSVQDYVKMVSRDKIRMYLDGTL